MTLTATGTGRASAGPSTPSAAILLNPRYTGYQVWNKQRRHEVLLDVDDAAAGYIGRLRWNPTDAWVFSESPPTSR